MITIDNPVNPFSIIIAFAFLLVFIYIFMVGMGEVGQKFGIFKRQSTLFSKKCVIGSEEIEITSNFLIAQNRKR